MSLFTIPFAFNQQPKQQHHVTLNNKYISGPGFLLLQPPMEQDLLMRFPDVP